MNAELDHLVVAARTLAEGVAWVRERLGAEPVAGGRHERMGTHNAVLSLGARRYLEVIAVDPAAAAPGRSRWFALDDPAVRARLDAGPALLHWVARTADLAAALRDYPEPVEVLELGRGPYRWRIGVPRDGRLPCAGACPTLIQWLAGAHPADALPASGCTLEALGRPGPARFSTPAGSRTLPWTAVAGE